MKIKELKEKNKADLKGILIEKKEELSQLRFDIAASQTKEHRDYRNLKRDIARILTVLKDAK